MDDDALFAAQLASLQEEADGEMARRLSYSGGGHAGHDDDAMLAQDFPSGKRRSLSKVSAAHTMGTQQLLFAVILQNDELSLCDRVGFACRLLPDEFVRAFLVGAYARGSVLLTDCSCWNILRA